MFMMILPTISLTITIIILIFISFWLYSLWQSFLKHRDNSAKIILIFVTLLWLQQIYTILIQTNLSFSLGLIEGLTILKVVERLITLGGILHIFYLSKRGNNE